MVNSRIRELMAKKLAGDASKDELDEFSSLLSKYPDFAFMQEIVLSLKGSKSHFEKDIPKEELVNHGWEELAGKLNVQATSSTPNERQFKIIWHKKFWLAAAVFLVMIGSGFFYFKEHLSRKEAITNKKIAEAHYGNTSKLVLSDGSQVWLNAGSKLTYPEKFSGALREVVLEGEGFFEVTKNAKIPFLVHAGKVTVKVLGTKFNVKAYNDDPDIEATLISGKVHVLLEDDPEKEIVLSPYEKLTVSKNAKSDETEQSNNELKFKVQTLPTASSINPPETAWVDNRLVFNNESLMDVAKMMERKYDVHINFEKEELKSEFVTGVFEKENIQQVLDVLKIIAHLNYAIDGNNIRLF